jgi:ERF superfamily protein
MSQQSETINELAAALSKAQGEMQAAIKDKINPFFKSSYADLGSVWDAARPVLSKYGLCVMQTTEIMSGEGAKIVMVTTLAHTSGQWVKSYLPLNPAKSDSQGIGAALTYLRRYALSAIVGVVCDDDDDGETAVGRGKNNGKPSNDYSPNQVQSSDANEKIEKSQIIALNDLIKNLDNESAKSFYDWIKKTFNASSINELPVEGFEACIVSLNRKIKYINDKSKQQQQVAVA